MCSARADCRSIVDYPVPSPLVGRDREGVSRKSLSNSPPQGAHKGGECRERASPPSWPGEATKLCFAPTFPAIHVLAFLEERRGCPAQGGARPGMTIQRFDRLSPAGYDNWIRSEERR